MNKILLTVSLGCLITSASAFSEGVMFSEIIGDCWEGHAHPQMSQCVQQRREEANIELNKVLKELQTGITKSEQSAGYSTERALAALEASSRAFQDYRTQQCSLVFAIASMGQGAEDNKLACETQLDIERTTQLKSTTPWLQ